MNQVRNFGDERADGETKKEEREENRNNVLMREKFRGKNIIIFFFFFTILLQCKKFCNIAIYNSLMQEFLRLKMSNSPYIRH